MIRTAYAAVTAALLGLPAALFAHALVFGGEHAAGGALSTAALAVGTLGLLVVVAIHSNGLVQGSVLASRMRDRTPAFAALAASGSLWFAALELCESGHSLPLIAIVAALLAACLIIRAAVAAVAHSVARIVIVLCSGIRVPADAAPHVQIRCDVPRAVRSFAHARRLFSRPPPALS